MPDEQTSDEVTSDTPIDKVREAYNRATKREKDLAEQVAGYEQTKRENAMLRAGVDLESPLGTLFMNGYAGELDPDAIKSAWGALPSSAPTPPPAGTPADETDAEALRRQEVSEALNNGSVAPGSEPPPDPVGAAYQMFHENIRKGMSRDRAMPLSLDVMLKAAMDGDERMLYDSQRYRETH